MPGPASVAFSAPTAPLSRSTVVDADPEDFDLTYDLPSFSAKHFPLPPPPPTGDGKHTPDSPTLGAADAMATAVAPEEGEERRGQGRFVRELEPPDAEAGAVGAASATAVGRGDGSDAERADARPTSSSLSTASNHTVNPATIPIRTSSTRAVSNGDRQRDANGATPPPKKSPSGTKSLRSVREEPRYAAKHNAKAPLDERDWLAQGQRYTWNGAGHGHTLSSSTSSSHGFGSRDLGKYTASPLGRQPSFTSNPPSTSHSTKPFRLTAAADLINDPASQHWSAEKENILRGPFEYLESHPGKDIRSQLISAFNAWLCVPPDSLAIITRVVAMLHTASLLVDDVEDSSMLRRGVPVAHHIFGTAQTINSANYIYFCALQELLQLHNPDAITIYTEELLNLHRGQGMDLFWRDTLTCPSEDDYLEMVGNKTGGLFRLAIKLMCAESPTRPLPPYASSAAGVSVQLADTYIPLVNTIGLLFQILDDYHNLSNPMYTSNKGLCEDLTEGKFSFPIIHAIRADPGNLVLINILRQKTSDDEVKRYAVQHMERTGSFSYTRRVLRGLSKRALTLLEEVEQRTGGQGKGVGVRSILEKMRVDRQMRGTEAV